MTEAPTHFIRLDDGRVRVLRLIAGRATYAIRYAIEPGESYCRICGCTDTYACAGGCSWADRRQTLCTKCLERMMTQ